MRRLSIGVRLTLWYLAIFAFAQVVFGAGMWFILRHQLYDLVDDRLEEQVDDLKNFLQSQPSDRSIAKLQEEVNETYAIVRRSCRRTHRHSYHLIKSSGPCCEAAKSMNGTFVSSRGSWR
jgi:hypothetical protein